MTDASPIRAAQVWEGLSSCLASLAALAPGCRTSRCAGATAITGATDDPAGNRLYVYAPDGAKTTVRSFAALLRRRRVGGSLVVGADARPVVAALSEDLCLDPSGELHLMIAHPDDLASPQPRGTPAVLEPVDGVPALEEMLALMALVLEVPRARLARLYPAAFLEMPGVRAFVSRRHGRLVSYVTTVSSEALTSVLNVGTHPRSRGRGEATVLLAAVLARLRHDGGELFALNAAPGESGLYRRLGFEVCDEGAVWDLDPDAGLPTP